MLLNGIAAQDATSGFDAQGHAALLVPLTRAQPAPLAFGALTVKVVKHGPDGRSIEAESTAFASSIVPGFRRRAVHRRGWQAARFHDGAGGAAPGERDRAALARGAKSSSYKIPCLPRADATTTLVAPLAGVSPGEYLVSVEIDGVASLLDWKDGRYTGPLVTVKDS